MRAKAVVTIESSFSGHLFHRAIRNLGYMPIMLSTDAGRYRHVDTPGLVTVTAETGSLERIVECCRALGTGYEVCGLLTTSSAFAAVAAEACNTLALPGPDPGAIARCLNKFDQRNAIREAGLLSPAYLLATSPQEAIELAARIGLPVIVKPAIGAGSMGVRLCATLDDVGAQASHILGSTEFTGSPGLLIEHYIVGPEFSVETIGDDIIGITTKHLGHHPFFVETGHMFPAKLGGDVAQAICATVRTAIRALGLHWGPAHTELRIGPEGPVIIEINPRMAGELIPELVRLAYGVDPVEQTVRLAIGEPVNLERQRQDVAAIRFINPETDGVLHWGANTGLAGSVASVVDVEIYRPEGFVVARHGDFRDRVGHVIAVTSDHVATTQALDRAFEFLGAQVMPI